MSRIKPLVKWAGGKTQLLDELLPLIPKNINTYYEPFIGGGALYFALEPKIAVINDCNVQLINLYKQTRDNLTKLKRQLTRLENAHINSDEYYLMIRDKYNKCLSKNELSLRSASLFLYLNKAGFNGLYRLNSFGQYNVPSSHKDKIVIYDRDNLECVSKSLQNTKLLSIDFENACANAKKGDFVFFDSPYYNTFDSYQANRFSEQDHLRLKQLFDKLSSKNVKCLLTNSNEKFIKDLYKNYDIKVIDVKRMINCDGKNRIGKEVIIKNY